MMMMMVVVMMMMVMVVMMIVVMVVMMMVVMMIVMMVVMCGGDDGCGNIMNIQTVINLMLLTSKLADDNDELQLATAGLHASSRN